MKAKAYITLGDWALVIVILALAASLFFMIPRWVLSSGSEVEVYSSNKILGRYPLHQDRIVEIPGPLGPADLDAGGRPPGGGRAAPLRSGS